MIVRKGQRDFLPDTAVVDYYEYRKPFSESDGRVFEDGASLVVERAVTVLKAIPLKHLIDAVPNH